MTAVHAAELTASWLGLLAAVAAVVSPTISRWSWGAAGLLFSTWLVFIASPGIGAVVATGALLALLLDGEGELAAHDFSRVTRRVGMLLVGLAAAVVLLVRVAEVDPGDAPHVFPVVAAAVMALIALLTAVEPAEINRAARLLLVLAAAGWTVATAGTEPAAAVAAAVALPLLGLTGRLGVRAEPDAPAEHEA
jgi:hypothetical protein